MEKQQTAVDWLYIKMFEEKGRITKEEYDKAKQMEWEQLCDAWIAGVDSLYRGIEPESANDYYNKTFNL